MQPSTPITAPNPLKVMVTGGTGFLGSHFVEAAVEAGHQVTVLLRPDTLARSVLDHLGDRITRYDGALNNKAALAEVLEGQDAAVHFAWASDPVEGWRNPLQEAEANIRSSVQLFETCAEQQVKKVLFASSGGTIYGAQEGLIPEEAVPRPFNPYGIGKLTVEYFLEYYRRRTGMAADVYRAGNAYGPGQRVDKKQGVIPTWMHQILQGETIQVFGGEGTLRDYIHVKDVANLMTYGLAEPDSSDTYNLGTGIGTSIVDMLHLFQAGIDVDFDVHQAPKRDLDNTSCILDVSKILSKVPGYTLRKLEDEIGPTWEDFKRAHGGS